MDLASLTQVTRKRYNRIAPLYDLMETFVERARFQKWRARLWSRVRPGRILEVGVGTGKNMPYYPPGARVTAIDLSEAMLARARSRARKLGLDVDLQWMDVQSLAFPDDAFDTAVATFVFCSVPDPIRGLQELARVVKPEGDIWLLEHVRVDRPIIGPLMDLLNPLVLKTSAETWSSSSMPAHPRLRHPAILHFLAEPLGERHSPGYTGGRSPFVPIFSNQGGLRCVIAWPVGYPSSSTVPSCPCSSSLWWAGRPPAGKVSCGHG